MPRPWGSNQNLRVTVSRSGFSTTAQWSAPPTGRTGGELVVLLHGHGGVEQDLTGIFPMLPDRVVGVALRGTVGDRWAWYDWYRQPLRVFDRSVQQVLAWVDEVWSDNQPVGLLGFSQGGALALELLRHVPLPFAYAGQICGFRMPGRRTDSVELQRRRPPTFCAVGGRDDVIARAESEEMTDWLRRHTAVSEHCYPHLGHEITDEVLEDAVAFITNRRSGSVATR